MIVAPLTMTSEREEVIDFVAPYFDQSGISIGGFFRSQLNYVLSKIMPFHKTFSNLDLLFIFISNILHLMKIWIKAMLVPTLETIPVFLHVCYPQDNPTFFQWFASVSEKSTCSSSWKSSSSKCGCQSSLPSLWQVRGASLCLDVLCRSCFYLKQSKTDVMWQHCRI